MTELIMKAYEVLDEIIESQTFHDLKKAKIKMEVHCEKHILLFSQAKINYEEILNYGGKFHPDYKKVVSHLSLTKQELYQFKEVIKYKELESELEKDINALLSTSTKLISNHIKIPNALGLIKQKEGGGCHVY